MNLTMRDSVSLAADVLDNSQFLNNKVCISIFPGTPSIFPVYEVIKGSGIHVGAQNVYAEAFGSFTGETSIPMIEEACDYLLVGHSERRRLFRETNANINRKIAMAIEYGIQPVLCIGEGDESALSDRKVETELSNQITEALSELSPSEISQVLFAYEPLSAIGSGVPARPESVSKKAGFIKETVINISDSKLRIEDLSVLYGGSVTVENAASYMELENVDGLLIGAASLKSDSFIKICHLAASTD